MLAFSLITVQLYNRWWTLKLAFMCFVCFVQGKINGSSWVQWVIRLPQTHVLEDWSSYDLEPRLLQTLSEVCPHRDSRSCFARVQKPPEVPTTNVSAPPNIWLFWPASWTLCLFKVLFKMIVGVLNNQTKLFPVVVMDYRRPTLPVSCLPARGLVCFTWGLSVSEDGFDRWYGVNTFGS